jgi:speckle-type POZ protein
MSPNITTWNLEQLLVNGKGLDVTFLVEERKINAHRLVIATRSPVLYEVVVGSNEDDHVVIIDDIKFAVFKAMLHFIYTDELLPIKDLAPAARDSGDDVMIVGEILAAACRFGMNKMKAKCEKVLGESTSIKNVSRILKLARHHHCSKLEDHCIELYLT